MKFNKINILLLTLLMAASFVLSGCAPKMPEETQAVQDPNAQATPAPTRAVVQATEAPNPGDILNMFAAADIERDIVNILLLGTDEDSSDGDGLGRNDTTMILQIDRVNKTMKLVSFMRDLEVEINGERRAFNMANYIGGPQKVAQLIDELFDVRIDYYAKVSFVAFTQIMDQIGNVKIDVQETEVETLKYAKGAVQIDNEVITGLGTVTAAGEQKLSTHLALSYARDRHTTLVDEETGYTLAGDEARNYRQRNLITQSWERVKIWPVEAVPAGVFATSFYADTGELTSNRALVLDEKTGNKKSINGEIITLITEMMEANAVVESMGIPLRTSSGTPYSSTLEDINTGEIISMPEGRRRYEEAEDRNDFDDWEGWRDAHYEVDHIITWNKSKARSAIHDFLIID